MLKINEAVYHFKGKDMFVQKNHSHNEIEIIHVVNGNGMVIKNDSTFELMSQHIYIIDARNVHIVNPQPEDCVNYIRSKIVIESDSFEAFCGDVGLSHLMERFYNSSPVSTNFNPEIDALYKKICKLVEDGSDESIGFAHGYVLELLDWIYLNTKEVSQRSQETTIQKVLGIISEKNGLTSLEEISELLHMNKYYISHMFKHKTGRNISDYISDKLYENALKLLKDATYTLEDIAFECGFSAASAFSRFFKSKSGMSPSKFRKGKT